MKKEDGFLSNHLKGQTSPYLLQHAEQPVNWYPWGEAAFAKAKAEDKPVFLSIGYSTCHWCHVMAHESFENKEAAALLNDSFVAIKVDKEERPDIDSIYMSVCQAFTGGGGWPTSIFMTPDQKPFFAGTYFPPHPKHGAPGFIDLLRVIGNEWEKNRTALIESADAMIRRLQEEIPVGKTTPDDALPDATVSFLKRSFDAVYGGFGSAPKFPMPHTLLFLMTMYETTGDKETLHMAEKTLTQLYKGGIFDHIGGGFSRYSTDRYFLAPHFEKMLYDNALLMMAYAKAYCLTKNTLYKEVAEQTASYLLREMQSPEGGFFSAQDADSEGVEGKYYLFSYEEIQSVLGPEDGMRFSARFNITSEGNFEGKNILHLLKQKKDDLLSPAWCKPLLNKLLAYRASRMSLHVDDKLLTAWNALAMAAFVALYQATGREADLETAKAVHRFISTHLKKDGLLCVSFRKGVCAGAGFLDDYAFYAFALLHLYNATWDTSYLEEAEQTCKEVMRQFHDAEQGGFFLYGTAHEKLLLKPKETHDGAYPSGNSMMAYNLVALAALRQGTSWQAEAEAQLSFLAGPAQTYPPGACFYLLSLVSFFNPPPSVVVVLGEKASLYALRNTIPPEISVTLLTQPTPEYQRLNDQTTYYICQNHTCLPPRNDWPETM
jgi:uncharacterized protein YyaL (SSP411 family)